MRNAAIPAAYAIFINDRNEVLLMRRLNTGYKDGEYGLPSGHVESHETPVQAAIREAAEETGLDFTADKANMAHVMYRLRSGENADRVDFFLTVREWRGAARNAEPHKCDDLRWVPLDALPPNTIDYVGDVLRGRLDTTAYSERSA